MTRPADSEARPWRPGRYLVPFAVLTVAAYFLFIVHHVLLPFVLAAALAYLLNPVVNALEVQGVRHRAAAIAIFLLFASVVLFLCGLTVSLATDQISRISVDMPVFAHRFQETIRASGWVERVPALEKWLDARNMHGWIAPLLERTPTVALKVLPVFELTFLVPFLAFLFMIDGVTMRDALLKGVPARYVEMVLGFLVEVDQSLGNYLRGLLVQAVFLGVFTGIGFTVIGLRYAVPIALWVAATSMVPLIGAISAAVAGSLVALVQWGTLTGVVKVLAVATAIRLLDDWFVQPLILRRAVHIHPAMTVFSLMAGGSLFGIWGLLFAVPAVCLVKVLLEVLWDWYRSEYGLQGSNPAPEVSHIPLI